MTVHLVRGRYHVEFKRKSSQSVVREARPDFVFIENVNIHDAKWQQDEHNRSILRCKRFAFDRPVDSDDDDGDDDGDDSLGACSWLPTLQLIAELGVPTMLTFSHRLERAYAEFEQLPQLPRSCAHGLARSQAHLARWWCSRSRPPTGVHSGRRAVAQARTCGRPSRCERCNARASS